jgi:hypothetical protein
MNDIFNISKNNKINWDKLYNESINNLISNENVDVNVIIGFRNRNEFIEPLIKSFEDAFNFYNENSENKKKFILTFVEHDLESYNMKNIPNTCNYLWSKGNVINQYSRSFSYNYGFKYSNNSKYYLFHDLDILIKKDFFIRIFKNLGDNKCLQSYGNRHIWYMSKKITDEFLNKKLNLDLIDKNNPEITAPDIKGSMGGSIFIEKNLYNDIGGFDPELFWGYAAEDQMFWHKVLTIEKIIYSDNPVIDLFHMWHPPTHNTNPLLMVMEESMIQFRNLEYNKKIEFLNLKKDLLHG